MKVKQIQWFPALTVAFALLIALLFGFRNLNRTPVQIYTLRTDTDSPIGISEPADSETDVPAEETSTESTGVPERININTATLEQLDALPGIGPTLAQRIIDYREAYGSFRSVGELVNVSGIGTQRLEAIWDLITVEGA
jgi:comEA protein